MMAPWSFSPNLNTCFFPHILFSPVHSNHSLCNVMTSCCLFLCLWPLLMCYFCCFPSAWWSFIILQNPAEVSYVKSSLWVTCIYCHLCHFGLKLFTFISVTLTKLCTSQKRPLILQSQKKCLAHYSMSLALLNWSISSSSLFLVTWIWTYTTWIQALASHGYWLPDHDQVIYPLRKPVFFCVNGRQWHLFLLNTHHLLELCVCSFILSHSILKIALSFTYCSHFTNKKAEPGQLK